MVSNRVLLIRGLYQLINLTTYKDDEIHEKDEVFDGTAAWAVHVAGWIVTLFDDCEIISNSCLNYAIIVISFIFAVNVTKQRLRIPFLRSPHYELMMNGTHKTNPETQGVC